MGIDPAEIAQAQWDTSRVMPWAHISTGVTTRYLALERKRAVAETTTPNCTFEKCTGCGACQALDCDNMLAGVRSMPSAPAAEAVASPAVAEVSGNDSSAEAASDECPLPASEGSAR